MASLPWATHESIWGEATRPTGVLRLNIHIAVLQQGLGTWRAGRPRPYEEVGEGYRDIHRTEEGMAQASSKLILAGRLADGLGGGVKEEGLFVVD